MNIRRQLLVYFSSLTIALMGIAFIIIYTLFANYRREEFQQRIKDKTVTTLKFMAEVQQIDHDLLRTMDEYTINNLSKEKILIFDNNKQLIYSSLDDTKIEFSANVLKQLSRDNSIIEFEEDDFDVVGVYFEFEEKEYYGISKAFDEFGLSKIVYLKYVLILIFIFISTLILISSFLLSRKISGPINQMALEMMKVNLETSNSKITVPQSKDEINLLANRFNELMMRLNNAFSFQKHAIHHISHELKTPIAILVSNLEKMENEKDLDKLKQGVISQKEDTKNLGDIINALLEISKVETGAALKQENLRIDELIFDVVEELQSVYPAFQFEVQIEDTIESEKALIVQGEKRLLRLALVNLAMNCIRYSSDGRAIVKIYNTNGQPAIDFINKGKIIGDHEKQYIFEHFFRGENSKGKRGFGLGLVLASKIAALHKADIVYNSNASDTNTFSIVFKAVH